MAADLVLKSTCLFTSASNASSPGAVAISGDKICAVGSFEQIEALIGHETRVLDLGDAFVCPGFHDSHLHFTSSAIGHSRFAVFCEGASREECADSLAAVADARPRDEFMIGYGWRQGAWEDISLPTKDVLDARWPDRPVVLQSGDCHNLWVNSAGLEKLGLTKDSVPPAGGIYAKDENGELTGLIQETAAMALTPVTMAGLSDDEYLEAARSFIRELNAQGITSVCDMALMALPGIEDLVRDRLYERLYDEGSLTVRMSLYPTALEDLTRAREVRDRLEGNAYVRLGGLKQFFDGVSSTHTAWLLDEYENPYFPGDCGRPNTDAELMRRIVLGANAEGFSVRIHTIGDRAIREAMDIFEESERVNGRLAHGHNGLEHLEGFAPGDVERLAGLDVCANVQPPHLTQDPPQYYRDLGEKRVQLMWPFASYVRLGVPFSFGTDSPVVDINSRNVLYDAVTRRDAVTREPAEGWLVHERISAADAVRAYTYGSAYACGREHELGTLEVGKLADICVLSHDIVGSPEKPVDPEQILSAEVLMTIVGGRIVFEA